MGNGNAAASGRSGRGEKCDQRRVYLAYNMYPGIFWTGDSYDLPQFPSGDGKLSASYISWNYRNVCYDFFRSFSCAEIRIPGILYFYSDKMDDTWNRRGILVSEENEKNDAKKMNFQVVAECSLFNYNQYIFYVWRILTRGGMLNEKENFFPHDGRNTVFRPQCTAG